MRALTLIAGFSLFAAAGGCEGRAPVLEAPYDDGDADTPGVLTPSVLEGEARPGTVSDPAIASVAPTTVELTFTEVDDGTGAPARYDIRYSESPMRWRWRSALSAGPGTCARPLTGERIGARMTCSIAGLDPSTSYDFQLVAFRGQDSPVYGSISPTVTAVTREADAGTPPPGTGTDLAIVEVTESSVSLRFTEVDDGAGRPAHYDIRYHPSPMGPDWGAATAVEMGSCSRPLAGREIGADLDCTVEGLDAATSYDFRMVAYRGELFEEDAAYGGFSNVASGKTEAATGSGSPPLGTLTLSPRTHEFSSLGDVADFSVTAMDGKWNSIILPSLTWTTSDPDVATVDAEGRVTARGVGAAMIAVVGTCCAADRAEVSVQQVVRTVAVAPTSAEVRENGTLRLSATALDANENAADAAPIVWSSSNPAIATVNSSGVVTGLREGRATIEATVGEATGSALVKVTPSASAPDESGGAGAHEPSNYEPITNRPFDARGDDGWGFNESSRFTIARDGTAPASCCNVGRARYPAGFGGGYGPVTTWNSFRDAGYTGIYISFWLKLSDNWQGHSSGVNKIGFVWIHGDASVYFSAQGSGSSTLRPQIRLQNVPVGRNLTPNVRSSAIERGRWHRWEVLLISNTDGRANGTARLWIDGQLVSDYRDVQYSSASQSRSWEHLYWHPVWGGRGDVVAREMSMYMDHIYASGRR